MPFPYANCLIGIFGVLDLPSLAFLFVGLFKLFLGFILWVAMEVHRGL